MFNGPVFNNEVVQANSRAVNNAGFSESLDEANSLYSRLTGASFELVPSSYKGGVVYSGVPNTGNGDLTWTRGSDAWRTNSNGLVQRAPWNLVGYSEDFSNLYWSKTNVTVTADNTTAPNGTNTADLISFTTSTGYIIKTLPIAASTQYTFSVYLKNNTFASGETLFLRVSDGVIAPAIARINLVAKTATYFTNPLAWTNISGQIEQLPNDWIRVSVTATSLGGGNGWIELAGDGFAKSCFAWGIQLVTGSSALPYFPTTDRLNVPRLSYEYGSSPALLLEPQRTNLALYSEDFSNASWTKVSGTVTSNSTSAPDGSTTADTFTSSGTSITIVARTASITSGSTYSLSFYVKQGTQRFVYIRFTSNALSNNFVSVVYDLQDGTVGQTQVGSSSGTLVSASVQSAGNGFYRLVLVASINQIDGNIGIGFASAKTGNTFNNFGGITSTITSGNDLYLWGAQLEAGSYATTYIPTTTTSVTRLAESFTRNNIYTNGLITAAGGTWFVELRNNVDYQRDASGGLYLGSQSSPTLGDVIAIRIPTTSKQQLRINVLAGGVTINTYSTTSENLKLITKWNGTSADVFVNGVKVLSSIAFTPTIFNNLDCNPGVPFFIQQMALFPTPLSDDQCVALTSDFTEGESVIGSYERYVNSNGGAVENLNTITNLIQNLK